MEEINFKNIERAIAEERFMEIHDMIKHIQHEIHERAKNLREYEIECCKNNTENNPETQEVIWYKEGVIDGLKFCMYYLEDKIYKKI